MCHVNHVSNIGTCRRLHIDEDADPTSEQVLHDLNNIGQINIEVECGVMGALVDSRPESPVVAAAASSKDVVKKNHISHATTFTAIGTCRQESSRTLFEPIKAQPVTLGLRFRSRNSLQLLKIIADDGDDDNSDSAHLSTRISTNKSDGPSSPLRPPTGTRKRRAEESEIREWSRKRRPMHTPSPLVNADQRCSAVAIKKELGDDTKSQPSTRRSPAGAQDFTWEHANRAEATAGRKSSTLTTRHPSLNPRTSSPVPRPGQHQQATTIKGEPSDLEIIEVRAAPRTQSNRATSTQPAYGRAAPQSERERALAELRLEELDLEQKQLEVQEKQLVVQQQRLEMRRKILEME